MDLWLHFFRSALASVSEIRKPVDAAEHAAEIADAALEAYGKRERGEVSVKGLETAKEKSRR
jgi:hypothetical protein